MKLYMILVVSIFSALLLSCGSDQKCKINDLDFTINNASVPGILIGKPKENEESNYFKVVSGDNVILKANHGCQNINWFVNGIEKGTASEISITTAEPGFIELLIKDKQNALIARKFVFVELSNPLKTKRDIINKPPPTVTPVTASISTPAIVYNPASQPNSKTPQVTQPIVSPTVVSQPAERPIGLTKIKEDPVNSVDTKIELNQDFLEAISCSTIKTAGYYYQDKCVSDEEEAEYSYMIEIDLRPKRDLKIESFVFNSGDNGEIRISLMKNSNTITSTTSLVNKGRKRVDLTELYAGLKSGNQYSLRVHSDQKLIETLSNCSQLQDPIIGEIGVAYGNKISIYDIKYCY